MENRTHTRYAVVFSERGCPLVPGGLDVTDEWLMLSGTSAGAHRKLSIGFEQIVGVRIGRLPVDRINGYPTVVLEREAMPSVRVAPLEPSCLHEIADLLSGLANSQAGSGDQLAIVVPLRPGCLERAAELIRQGPPFDPAALELSGHQVYLREHEAIFLFSGEDVRARVRRALREPSVWRAGVAWQECIAGRPRLTEPSSERLTGATLVFSWSARTAAG